LLGAVWTNAVMLKILKEFSISNYISGVPIFSARWDHSGMSLCLGILLWSDFRKLGFKANNFVRAFLILSVLLQYSRASYVSLAFVLMVLIYSASKGNTKVASSNRKLFTILVVVLSTALAGISVAAFNLPENSALSRIGISNFASPQKLISETRSSGTANARILANKRLIDWVYEEDLEWTGAGPGREMILESGSHGYLSGARDVRSPHSWPVGNFSRFGYIGFLIWHFATFAFLRFFGPSLNPFKYPNNFVVTIYIVSFFGVILEAPFGIMPMSFFLAMGRLGEADNDEG